MSLFRHSAWAAAAAITLTASRFALGAVLTRRLTQETFGQYAYGQWLVDLAFLLCSLGATGAASRYFAEYRHDPGLSAAFFRHWRPFAIGLPLLAAAGVFVCAPVAGIVLTSSGLLLLAVWTLTNGLWAMQTAALVGLQRFDLIFKANFLVAAVMLLGAFILPLSSSDPASAFALMSVACVCGMSVGWSGTHRLGHGHQPQSLSSRRAVTGYALNIWFSALVASLIWSRGELPFVKLMLGDAAVAHYSVALTVFGGAIQGLMLGVSGVAPHLTRLWGEGRKGEAVALSRSIMDVQLLLCACGSLVIICFGSEIVSLAFTNKYHDAAAPLSILCFGLISFAVSSQTQLLQLETNARFNRNTILVGLFFLYVLAFFLIPGSGLVGAATARSAAMLILGAATIAFAVRYWGWHAISIRNIVLVLLVQSGTVAALISLQPMSMALRLILLGSAVAAILLFLRDAKGQRVVRRVSHVLFPRLQHLARSVGRKFGWQL
jgi:O-antigen/teichoic acid export membrane protein